MIICSQDVKNLRSLVERTWTRGNSTRLTKTEGDRRGKGGPDERVVAERSGLEEESLDTLKDSETDKGEIDSAVVGEAKLNEIPLVMAKSSFSPPPSPSSMPSLAEVSRAISEGREADLATEMPRVSPHAPGHAQPPPALLPELHTSRVGGGQLASLESSSVDAAHDSRPYGAKQPKPWERAGAQ